MADPSILKLQLVHASAVDVGRVAAVVNAAFAVYPFMGGDRTTAEEIAEEMGESGEFILASEDGAIVGCAMIRPSLDVDWGVDSGAAINAADAVYLGLVAVEPRIRKQGLGRRMITEAERIARERGFARMVLGTVAEMGNVAYYEPMGYAVVDRTRFGAGHWEMTIDHEFCVMVKAL